MKLVRLKEAINCVDCIKDVSTRVLSAILLNRKVLPKGKHGNYNLYSLAEIEASFEKMPYTKYKKRGKDDIVIELNSTRKEVMPSRKYDCINYYSCIDKASRINKNVDCSSCCLYKKDKMYMWR